MTFYDPQADKPALIPDLHDPAGKVDYGFNFRGQIKPYLETSESIVISTWQSLTAGVTLGSGSYADSSDGSATKVWVVAITDANITFFDLENTITTDSSPPRIVPFQMRIRIRGRQ